MDERAGSLADAQYLDIHELVRRHGSIEAALRTLET